MCDGVWRRIIVLRKGFLAADHRKESNYYNTTDRVNSTATATARRVACGKSYLVQGTYLLVTAKKKKKKKKLSCEIEKLLKTPFAS